MDYSGIIGPISLEWSKVFFGRIGTENSADLSTAGTNPKTMRYRASSRGLQTHPGSTPIYSPWATELCRFHVPWGKVGVVKAFEQYLAQEAEGENPAFVYTQNSRWGVPGPWHTGITNPVSDLGTWNFRLHHVGRTIPQWWTGTGGVPLPDAPYTDHAVESLLWFPAGSCASQQIHLVVPGGYILRVIYETPEQNVKMSVAAHLKGFVQSDRSPESAHNVRCNW